MLWLDGSADLCSSDRKSTRLNSSHTIISYDWSSDVCSRSEEHTSELQSHDNLVCRLLLEKNTHRRAPPRRGGGTPRYFPRLDAPRAARRHSAQRLSARFASSWAGSAKCFFFFFLSERRPPKSSPFPPRPPPPV